MPRGENKHIRDLNPQRHFASGESAILYAEYKNLLMNALSVEGVGYVEETLIKNALIEHGCVGYDRVTDKWCYVYGEGLNEYGNPTILNFVFRNGISFVRKAYYEPDANGAYIINAMPETFAVGGLISRATDFFTDCNRAIRQNICASKNPKIIVSKSKDIQLSIEHAIDDQQTGKPVLVVSEELGEALKGIDMTVEYVADKILEIRDKERDHLLNKLGIMSANVNKRERVQVGEVNATVGQCEDYIYLFIDTFNKQMKAYELPFEMRLNGSLESLYDDTETTNPGQDEQPTETSMEGMKEND